MSTRTDAEMHDLALAGRVASRHVKKQEDGARRHPAVLVAPPPAAVDVSGRRDSLIAHDNDIVRRIIRHAITQAPVTERCVCSRL